MSYSAQGSLLVKNDTRQISDTFQIREFVLQITDGKYAQDVQFQLAGDKCDMLDGANLGDVIDVEFNLRGKAWTSPKDGEVRYFNKLDVWRMKVADTGHKVESDFGGEPTDDIPF